MIKYIGKKHLNSNFYKQITLQQKTDFIKVTSVLDERLKKAIILETDTKCITDQVNSLDDYNKIKEIILYFLRNNVICEISQETDRVLVSATSNRKLILKLGKEYSSLLGLIIAKYNNDRLKFLDECNQKYIYIRTVHFEKHKIISGKSNYFEGYEESNKENTALVLTLASKGKNIAAFDKVFITEYIKEILYNSSKTIIAFDRHDLNGLTILVDDIKIKVPEELKKEIKLLVFNRNIEIDKMNNKQYKLEGIKWKN